MHPVHYYKQNAKKHSQSTTADYRSPFTLLQRTKQARLLIFLKKWCRELKVSNISYRSYWWHRNNIRKNIQYCLPKSVETANQILADKATSLTCCWGRPTVVGAMRSLGSQNIGQCGNSSSSLGPLAWMRLCLWFWRCINGGGQGSHCWCTLSMSAITWAWGPLIRLKHSIGWLADKKYCEGNY